MSRLTKCAVPGPFRTGIESGVPRAVCRSDIGAASAHRPRSGDRSGSMTRAPRAGCPARFPAGLAVTPAFSGSALYGAGRYPSSTVSMGPSLAQGRVDPMRVLVMASLGQDSALSVGWWCLAAHGPTSCFSPTRRGALADLSRCKRLPGVAVNCARVWRQVPQQSLGPHRCLLRAPIMLVTGGWGARSCSQRRRNSLTGTPDERPRPPGCG